MKIDILGQVLATAIMAVLLWPVSGDAQTLPSPSGISPTSPGGFLGGLFGGGDNAKESTQLAHMALHEVGNAARLEALLKQLMSMPESSTAGVVADIQSLLNELARINESFETIYDDPSSSGTHAASVEYRNMQHERQLQRLEEMNATAEEIRTKVSAVSGSTDELAALNKGAIGGLDATQINTEVGLLNLDLQRQQSLTQMEIWRSLAQQEARKTEDEILAEARNCAIWGPDFYDSGSCK